MKTIIKVPCLSVTQPIGSFYLGKLTAGQLLTHVSILRRGLTAEEQRNVQRKLSDRRQREIAEYVLTDPDATFPTSIIVSVPEDSVTFDKPNSQLVFEFEDKLGEVLDGQHRLEGLALAAKEGNAEQILSFELPVVFMIDLEPDDKAYVFSIINSKQTQVPSSLIFDLFGLQTSRSPSKTCHWVAQTLNSKEGSPFYQRVKMLGNKHLDSEILTQGAFAKYLLKLISKTPDVDARLEKAKKRPARDDSLPFRKFYLEGEDSVIAKIVENYFLAVAKVFPQEWAEQPKNFLLRKAAGYSALMTVLNSIWRTEIETKKDATYETFVPIVQRLKQGLEGKKITSEVFGSSEHGAKTLANALLSGLNQKTQ